MIYRRGSIAVAMMPFIALTVSILAFYTFATFDRTQDARQHELSTFSLSAAGIDEVISGAVTETITAARNDAVTNGAPFSLITFKEQLRLRAITQRELNDDRYGDIFFLLSEGVYTLITLDDSSYQLTVARAQTIVRSAPETEYSELRYPYTLTATFGGRGKVIIRLTPATQGI
jgi:hypothetical protein